MLFSWPLIYSSNAENNDHNYNLVGNPVGIGIYIHEYYVLKDEPNKLY